MQTDIHKLIDTSNFFHYTQGLFDTENRLKVGNEILFRSNIGGPEVIFHEAKISNRLFELESKSILKILNTYFSQELLQLDRMFINVYPSTLLNCQFPELVNYILNHFPIPKKTFVFEIIETEQVEDIVLFKERIAFLRDLGFLIAIDDVGKGWSSLSMIIELEPDYIKLDHYFSMNLSSSISKQEMIKSILHYAKKFEIQVVIEGIENSADLAIAKLLGIPICQGYILERPKPIAV